MAEETTPERSAEPSDVTVISVTVSVPLAARRHPLRERLAAVRVPWPAVVAVAALAALGWIVAAGLPSSHTRRPARASRTAVQHGRTPPTALDYPYPLRCLSMTISAINPVYVAEVERANRCWGYSRSVTASFHRVDGRWRLMLDNGQLFETNRPVTSLGCLSLSVAIHDPTFVGPDRAICMRGQPVWLP
jgi:hypothetical protein